MKRQRQVWVGSVRLACRTIAELKKIPDDSALTPSYGSASLRTCIHSNSNESAIIAEFIESKFKKTLRLTIGVGRLAGERKAIEHGQGPCCKVLITTYARLSHTQIVPHTGCPLTPLLRLAKPLVQIRPRAGHHAFRHPLQVFRQCRRTHRIERSRLHSADMTSNLIRLKLCLDFALDDKAPLVVIVDHDVRKAAGLVIQTCSRRVTRQSLLQNVQSRTPGLLNS